MTQEDNILRAGEGMMLTNSSAYSDLVFLSKLDSADNWREVTQEEYGAWLAEQEKAQEAAEDPTTDPTADPTEETADLAGAVERKVKEIEAYDSSEAVNSFTFNGSRLWFDAETRAGFKNSIESAILLGEGTIDVPTTVGIITLPTETAQTILAKVQRYADACYIVTQKHIAAVKQLGTVEEVEAYDHTVGYPDKLAFTA